MRHVLPAPSLLPVLLLAGLLGGCTTGSSSDARSDGSGGQGKGAVQPKTFDTSAVPATGSDAAAVQDEIGQLARGKEAKDDDGQAVHDDAVSKLSRRGAAVQLRIIDAMRSSPDWNIRLGCIEVLQSIGTKTCIPHLISMLQDSDPLIALHANVTLQALTSHREIPVPGGAIGANGLPPVPRAQADQLEMDTELKIWTHWYDNHHQALHDAWDTWWKSNNTRVTID